MFKFTVVKEHLPFTTIFFKSKRGLHSKERLYCKKCCSKFTPRFWPPGWSSFSVDSVLLFVRVVELDESPAFLLCKSKENRVALHSQFDSIRQFRIWTDTSKIPPVWISIDSLNKSQIWNCMYRYLSSTHRYVENFLNKPLISEQTWKVHKTGLSVSETNRTVIDKGSSKWLYVLAYLALNFIPALSSCQSSSSLWRSWKPTFIQRSTIRTDNT